MSPTFLVRLSSKEELSQLAAIEKSAMSRFRWTKYEVLRMTSGLEFSFLTQKQKEDNVLVAISDGLLVGYAVVSQVENWTHLEEMAVHLDFSRRGIGSALLNEVKHRAQTIFHADFVSLSTFRSTPWNASFYFKNGFVEMGIEKSFPYFAELREKEEQAGFPIQDRILMKAHLI
jgi:ribosomal protein S18 acetylase RimI-like enzyme